MKQLFIFTRTYYADYQLLVAPSEDFCPGEIRQVLRNQVRGLINVDQYNPDLSNPRWFLSRLNGYTLWGVGCWNKALSEEYFCDEVHRSDLRCFVGILSHGEDISELPYDISFFASEFKKAIGPLFMLPRGDIKIQEGLIPQKYDGVMKIERKFYPGLNTVEGTCVLHDVENMKNLFGAALVGSSDLSIVSNLLNVDLAFDERYKYMNASVIGIQGGQVHRFNMETTIEGTVHESAVQAPDESIKYKNALEAERKKAKSLMLIAAILLILLLITIIIKGTRQ